MPGISDHDIVMLEARPVAKRNRPVKRKIHLWKKVDLQKLKGEAQILQQEFQNRFSETSSAEEMWKFIHESLTAMMKNTVPSKMSSTRFNQPWINKEVKKVSRLKKKYFIKARNSQLPEDRNKYQEIKKIARKTCKQAYRDYIHNIISPDC